MEKAKAIKIGGIPVDLFEEEDYKSLLMSAVAQQSKKIFFHTNAHLVVLANRSATWLKEAFAQRADYVICDGAGIQFGARLVGKPIPNKVAYNVWFWDYAQFCAENGFRVFFLGGKQEVVERAAENMKAHAVNLIVDSHHGYFDKTKNSEENREVINKINAFGPQLILVGFGMPVQEQWILENAESINSNAFFSCGGAFDFFAGKSSLAPKWVRKIRFEWFYRMMLEPLRLGKRYLLENPLFIYYVFRNR